MNNLSNVSTEQLLKQKKWLEDRAVLLNPNSTMLADIKADYLQK